MQKFKSIAAALGLVVPLALAGTPACADDQLKLAIGQINNWENQAPTLGQDAGIFKKHGLVLENIGSQGAGETIPAEFVRKNVGVKPRLWGLAQPSPARIANGPRNRCGGLSGC